MKFGKKLKELLSARGISQAEYATAISMNTGLLNRYLKGEKPSIDFIEKTLEFFPDIDANYFFKDEMMPGVNEAGETYLKKKPEAIMFEIENKWKELRTALAQK